MPTRLELLNKELIKNSIGLQKKIAELTININKLTKRVDTLVGIFEDAAKKVKPGFEDAELRPLIERVERLTEQNKNVVRGLMLLEKYVKDKGARLG